MVSGWEDCCGLGTSPLLFGVEYMGERNIETMWMCRASYGQDQTVNLDVCCFTNLNFSQCFSLVLLVHAFCVLGSFPVSSGIISNWWTHHRLKSGWRDYLLVCLFFYIFCLIDRAQNQMIELCIGGVSSHASVFLPPFICSGFVYNFCWFASIFSQLYVSPTHLTWAQPLCFL